MAKRHNWSRGRGWVVCVPEECYECGSPLFGPICPKCNPLAAAPEPPAAALSPAVEGLVKALEKLLTLTKFELGDNCERQPWKRNIERCEAALDAWRKT